MAFKTKAGPGGTIRKNFPQAFKQNNVSIQDNTRTTKAKEITIPKFDAENAWKTGGKEKYYQLNKTQFTSQYNKTSKSIDKDNRKSRTGKIGDKEKQEMKDHSSQNYRKGNSTCGQQEQYNVIKVN